MKTFSFFLTLAIWMISTALFAQTAQNTITSSEIKVTISGATSRMDLADLRRELLPLGVDFQYRPHFDENRNLTGIQYTLTRVADGSSLGEATADNLSNPTVKTSFRLIKEADRYISTCVGNCHD